uniref:Uncharacterized protein n=1 Tax=Cannabis sativa TaxID=3483 RepID=A0A803Q2U0_CANSA
MIAIAWFELVTFNGIRDFGLFERKLEGNTYSSKGLANMKYTVDEESQAVILLRSITVAYQEHKLVIMYGSDTLTLDDVHGALARGREHNRGGINLRVITDFSRDPNPEGNITKTENVTFVEKLDTSRDSVLSLRINSKKKGKRSMIQLQMWKIQINFHLMETCIWFQIKESWENGFLNLDAHIICVLLLKTLLITRKLTLCYIPISLMEDARDVAMKKSIKTAGIHVHPKAMPLGLEETQEETFPSTQKAKNMEPSPIRYYSEGNPKRNPTPFPKKNKKAQDLRKVYSDFPKGKGPQRGRLPRKSTGPQDREDRKSVSMHQEPGERGRKSRKHPPANLRQKLNDKDGDLRKHLEKTKQAIPVSKGIINEGILAELTILRKDISRVS